MEKKTRHARLNDKSTTRTNRSFSRPRPRTGAIRALQESHKSITMASITSSAVFGKVSALKASKSVKRCVRCEDDSKRARARGSRATIAGGIASRRVARVDARCARIATAGPLDRDRGSGRRSGRVRTTRRSGTPRAVCGKSERVL